MVGSYNFCDYYYINHYNKYVTFSFDFKKRVKSKVTNILRKTKEEAKLIKEFESLRLKLEKQSTSKKYIHYIISDLERI